MTPARFNHQVSGILEERTLQTQLSPTSIRSKHGKKARHRRIEAAPCPHESTHLSVDVYGSVQKHSHGLLPVLLGHALAVLLLSGQPQQMHHARKNASRVLQGVLAGCQARYGSDFEDEPLFLFRPADDSSQQFRRLGPQNVLCTNTQATTTS